MPKLLTKDKISALKAPKRVSLWNGPEDSGPMGGITYSALSRFLCCRERFRLMLVEGWKVKDVFTHRLEYGNLFHAAEEASAGGKPWKPAVVAYANGLAQKYKGSGPEIDKWYRVCCLQYPIYLKHWSKHPDEKKRKSIYQEQVFHVSYQLPSRRVVYLRGKFDAVDFIDNGIWLGEDKSKGEIDVEKLTAELCFDLQTNIYLTALDNIKLPKQFDGKPIKGVRYNVIRRPLSSYGKHNIKQHQGRKLKSGEIKGAETLDEYYNRLSGLIEKHPNDFFQRWKIETTPTDLLNFQRWILNPILEQLCDWWESIQGNPFDPWETSGVNLAPTMYGIAGCPERVPNPYHFTYPTGVWNPALEGRVGDLDRYLQSSDAGGLQKVKALFPELQPVQVVE